MSEAKETPTEKPILKKHDILVVRNIAPDYSTRKYKQAILHIREVNYLNTDIPELRVPNTISYRVIFTDDGFWTDFQSFDIDIDEINILRRLDVDMTNVESYTQLRQIIENNHAEYLI